MPTETPVVAPWTGLSWLAALVGLPARFPLASSVFLAAALALPSLGVGFVLEDFAFLAALSGGGSPHDAADLYRFAPADEDVRRLLLDQGLLPWWTAPDLRIAFWRPLSGLLLRLDHLVWGRVAAGYHLHSLLWYLLTITASGLVLRRVLGPRTTGWALLLFAVAAPHAVPVAWIANRHALVAAAPALLGLAAHLRWRQAGWRPGLPLSLLGLAGGLAGGEAALGVLGYWCAYGLFGEPAPLPRRLLGLLPAAALAGAYFVAHTVLGYGVADGAGLYFDPRASPGLWLAHAPARLGLLLSGLTWRWPFDLWLVAPGTRPVFVLGGLAGLFVLAWLGWCLAPRLPDRDRAALRWLLPGAACALVPLVGTLPMARLLLLPDLGLAVAVAVLLEAAWRSRGQQPGRVRVVAGLLAVLHGLLTLPAWGVQTALLAGMSRRTTAAALALDSLPGGLAGRIAVIVDAPAKLAVYDPFLVRRALGLPVPATVHLLAMTPYDLRVTRTGPAVLTLTVVDGALLTSPSELQVRPPHQPLRAGAEVHLATLTVQVLRDDGRHPVELDFRFDRPLEDPSVLPLGWQGDRLLPSTLPGVGERLDLRAPRPGPTSGSGRPAAR